MTWRDVAAGVGRGVLRMRTGVAVGVVALVVVACPGEADPAPPSEAAVLRPAAVGRQTPPAPARTGPTGPGHSGQAAPAPTPDPVVPIGPATTPAPSAGSWWRPAPGTTWQWQLSGTVDVTVPAAVFDIDGEAATAAMVAGLHDRGAKVVCYVDVGAWESYRGDAGAFPSAVLGSAVEGWPEERWLDVRALDVLLPIMEARVADCAAKGFDAVEPDLVDGYANDTGFPLGARDQIAYNSAIADLVHRYGMGVALKNDAEQVGELEPLFDFAVVEECVVWDECGAYSPFIAAGKAVLHVEYTLDPGEFCPQVSALGFSSMRKNLELDAWRATCW